MKIFKTIFNYLFILTLILLALALVLAGYLALFPGKSLFGFQYISMDELKSMNCEYAMSDIEHISINTGRYDVQLLPTFGSEQYVSVSYDASYTGIAKVKNAEFAISSEYFATDHTLAIQTLEPTGLLSYRKAEIRVYIPVGAIDDVDVSISTTKGSVTVGEGADASEPIGVMHLGGLTIKAGKDDVLVQKTAISGTTDISTTRGDISFADDVHIDGDVVSLTTNRGKITLIDGVSDHSLMYVVTIREAGKVIGDIPNDNVEINVVGGTVDISDAKTLSGYGETAKITVGNISGIVDLRHKKNGSISLGKIGGIANISATKANVHIVSLNDDATISSTGGNIVVEGALKFVSASTESGDIYIHYLNDDTHNHFYNQTDKYNTALISTKKGNIKVYNVEYLTLTSIISSNIYVDFKNIPDENSVITAKSGSIKIVTPDGTVLAGDTNGLPYVVTYTTAGTSDVNIHGQAYDNTPGTHTARVYIDPDDPTVINAKLIIDANKASLWIRDRSLANE